MPYLLKSCGKPGYIKVSFCPLRGELVQDINRATSWEHKETADTVAMEFCAVKVVSYADEITVPELKIKTELQKLMDDPKYWRDYDPEIVKRIDELFNKLYYKE